MVHIMNQSSIIFKQFLKMLKTPSDSQLLSFLKKLKKLLSSVSVGDTLLLPAYVEGKELLIYLERINERIFKIVIIQTDPHWGLEFHAVSVAQSMPKISYRTCLVLNDVPKKNVLDDVFWLGVYNMAIRSHANDTDKFYDVLLPFLTGKPLEASLVESETAALAHSSQNESVDIKTDGTTDLKTIENNIKNEIETEINLFEKCGSWRSPQRSKTAYVRCIFEAFHYVLRRRGLTELQSNQIHLSLLLELTHMIRNDLQYMLPGDNGVRVCSLALRELSRYSVEVIDEIEKFQSNLAVKTIDCSLILKEVHDIVEDVNDKLSFSLINDSNLPPVIDLSDVKTIDDPSDLALVQYKNSLVWDVNDTEPDPGQQVTLRPYIPVDLLQIPKRATTRDEAITAIRMCDRLVTLIDNQYHCIKNDKFIIAAIIENVFTQVVPVPKPRGIQLTADEIYTAERTKRRQEKKDIEDKLKSEEKKKEETKNKKKKNNDKEEELNVPVIVAKPIGEEELPNFEEGKEVETKFSEIDCIWDQEISYELQVRLISFELN